MAELVLSTIGRTIGSRLPGIWGTIGATLGRVGGGYLGRSIDQSLFGARRGYEGVRLSDLHFQASTEGASMPCVYGRVRVAGQVIWAARFREHAETEEVSSGGKGGGGRTTTKAYTYSLSFAVGLCEGEIARIGRVWANGENFDLSQVAWRLHVGGEGQEPDPLIESIEGADNAPAYRGLAYIVFEDLPLADFGNVIPQLSFEIVRPAPSDGVRFEERVRGVCLIPGAGEFVYATEPVFRRAGEGREVAENAHAETARANLLVSLDQLATDFPNCESVLLVVGWFGDDLRCGACTIRPGVEIADKETSPQVWKAGAVTRDGARVVSSFEGAPAFGGTPSDESVKQAIVELKARGYKVGLYPFLFMDVAHGNELPDPYGGETQAAYPWRGRITVYPAAGEPGSPDKTATAAAQINAFFGAASAGDFGAGDGLPTYAGPAEWSYRRFILHYAKLAALAGGVDSFIIGSELRGLTTARDSVSTYPAVTALQSLAAQVRALVGGDATLTYAADWSEYFGHQPQDSSGDVFFHLDPLWADANIDVIGIDWYPPLSDWRDGATHADAALARAIYDGDYLAGRIEAGEGYDWHYASDADRAAQSRTMISDGAYDEPWIWRAKDIRNFWSRAHYNRPGGVRALSPTAWTPESKPVWLIELGCPAIDKGANAPNLFIDDKSEESDLPHASSGARDDLIQRRTLEAYLKYWDAEAPTNPISSLTGKPMIEAMMLWAWDARPYPQFPALGGVWADAPAWRLGHWLNGRAGLSELGDVVRGICARAGVEADVSFLTGAVSGLVVDGPAAARDALEPLMAAYEFDAAEADGEIGFFHRSGGDTTLVAPAAFAAQSAGDMFAHRGDPAETPIEARVRFIDAGRDYRVGAVSARRLDRAEGGVETIDAPLVLEPEAAEALAQRVLADRRARMEALAVELGPAHMALQPGDRVRLGDGADGFVVERVTEAETQALELRRVRAASPVRVSIVDPSAPPNPAAASTPALAVLDLPLLPGAEDDERPLAAVAATPWLGAHEVFVGASLSRRTSVPQAAVMGELLWALWPGPVDRWDEGNYFRVQLYNGTLASVGKDEALNGANAFAIQSGGEWEVIQARNCTLTGPGAYELRGLLRGRLGSAHAMASPHPVGARIVRLDQKLARLSLSAHEWGEPLVFSAPPYGRASSDPRAARLTATLPHAALRPWAPAHLTAWREAGGDVVIAWVRCARLGGDAWGEGEPPLGEANEAYLLEIVNGTSAVRRVVVGESHYVYSATDQTADFGSLPASVSVRVGQLRANGATGLISELTIPL